MDVLSDILAICRSERAVTARFALTQPWGLASAGTPGAIIWLARGNSYWMQIEDQPAVRIAPGDLVLVRPGIRHRIGSSPQADTTPFAELIARYAIGPRGERPLVFAHGGGGASTDLFSTQLWFSAFCRHAVLRILPAYVHIRETDLSWTSSLGATMQALTEETLSQRPGWRLSAARMGELLLVNMLREHLASQGKGTGWLRGIMDPAIARAIGLMHRRPQDNWTVANLAREAGLSRTRFSARFRELVDASPIGYLHAHRMALAAEALELEGRPLARIAQDAGYESDKAFARAFRRWSGLTPAAYLKREMERREHIDLLRT